MRAVFMWTPRVGLSQEDINDFLDRQWSQEKFRWVGHRSNGVCDNFVTKWCTNNGVWCRPAAAEFSTYGRDAYRIRDKNCLQDLVGTDVYFFNGTHTSLSESVTNSTRSCSFYNCIRLVSGFFCRQISPENCSV